MKKLLTVFFLFFIVFAAYAREITVTVVDAELDIPLEGAAVRAGNETFYTGASGAVRFDISTDTAVITVSCPGYESTRVSGSAAGNIRVTLRPGDIMEGRELVVEERRPGASETRSGRSVAISGPELQRTAQIGIVEDVISSIKLLPGVGYSGMFNALPSIRGGDPGDLMAVFDGFYISMPYHWGGGVSIFDPRMVESAQLSHGVFSARYGHTISGLLEVRSRNPSREITELDMGLSTSATNLALSWPLAGKGGVVFTGKVTYWDLFVWALRGVNSFAHDETLAALDSVSAAPYIRSVSLSLEYRFAENILFAFNSFFGSDGVGAAYANDYSEPDIRGSVDMNFDYNNYLGFAVARAVISPSLNTALDIAAGAGFTRMMSGGFVMNDVAVNYRQDFLDSFFPGGSLTSADTYHAPDFSGHIDADNINFNAQARANFEYSIGGGFLVAAGVQELYSQWEEHDAMGMGFEMKIARLPAAMQAALSRLAIAALPGAAIIQPVDYSLDTVNRGFSTSLYTLGEYRSPGGVFGAELGLRADHLYFITGGAGLQTWPVFNPRLNLDFIPLRDWWIVESLELSAGTGLFSSTSDSIALTEDSYGLGDFDIKPNRSFTTVIGTKIDFSGGVTFSLEGYYKYVFDRAYLLTAIEGSGAAPAFAFDAEGQVWGFDLQLQKHSSRWIDGWISYTFNYAQYREPSRTRSGSFVINGLAQTGDWYFPSFHRFHNINLVLNIKPSRRFNIAMRFGFASGRPVSVRGDVYAYPVELVRFNDQGIPVEQKWDDATSSWVDAAPGQGTVIQKFRRDTFLDRTARSAASFPLDVKFSFFFSGNRRNAASRRVTSEMYLAAENLLSLIPGEKTVTFNEYTGREDIGSSSASYGLPVPMVSFGFTWRY